MPCRGCPARMIPRRSLLSSAPAIRSCLHGGPRRGDNLFTCALIAVNVETGKDGLVFPDLAPRHARLGFAQTPILIDGVINGRMRKLVSTAARNGYFFTLDSRHRRALRDREARDATNWSRASRRMVRCVAIPERTRRSPVRWYRRPRAAPSTGSRRRIRPTRACSTYPSATVIPSSI